VERSVMSTVALTAGIMETLQQAGEDFEILEAFNIGFFDFW